MTLIACTSNFGFPILIGDLLMSSTSNGNDITLPTYPEGFIELFPSDSIRKPIYLRQKSFIISDNLAIALAGREDKIASFLNSIRSWFWDKEITQDGLSEFCEIFQKNLKV
jgi:hypothetical protein